MDKIIYKLSPLLNLSLVASRNASNQEAKQSGFTLIELMVVIVIITIFAVIAVPSYQQYARKADASAAEQEIQKIAEMKMPDLNAGSLEAAMSMIAGTARSMGITVEE